MNDTEISTLQMKHAIASVPEIIQSKLLYPDELASYARDHKLTAINTDIIIGLWNMGFLQADIVKSSHLLKIDGLTQFSELSNGKYIYYDNRTPVDNLQNLNNTLENEIELKEGVDLYFHPFRFYILNHFTRGISYDNDSFYSSSFYSKYQQSSITLNNVTTLLIFLEPYSHLNIFNTYTYLWPDTRKIFIEKRNIRLELIKEELNNTGVDRLEKIRKSLCIEACGLDKNTELHLLLRMAKKSFREKITDTLGSAMLFLTMAETLRLATEATFKLELEEEYGFGFSSRDSDSTKKLYGSTRLYDAPRRNRNEFIRQCGLDYSTRVRCYVEGYTEEGVIENAFKNFEGIEIINLKGRVVADKLVSFGDLLRNDREAQIFSIVLIDGDREDYVRALQKAAVNNEICGTFMISNPDFEFANFTIDELSEIIFDYFKSHRNEKFSLREIKNKMSETTTSNDFFEKIETIAPPATSLSKGKKWGALLMDYAVRYPNIDSNGIKIDTKRPILERVRLIQNCFTSSYEITQANYKVCPDTGRLIARET